MGITFKLAIITLLMTYISRGTNEDHHLGFLNQLVQKIQHEEPIETMLILQHYRDEDCELRNWNHREIPTVRFNQLDVVEVRNHLNHVAVAVVCICQDYDTSLLDSLAKNFNRMRQGRIILWVQAKLTQDMLNAIANRVEQHQFLQMLILEVRNEPKETVAIRRLYPFPVSHFHRIDNIFNLKGSLFHPPEINFKGRAINLLPNWDGAFKYNVTLPSKDSVPIARIQDVGILEFAFKYNISLRVLDKLTSSVIPDIQMNTHIHTHMDHLKTWNAFDISSVLVAVPSSLIVIVPCSRKRAIRDVFRQLNVLPLLLWILPIYVVFVAVETCILMLSHRFRGHTYRLTCMNRLLNLRAFRAILGLPFPISRQSSISLRQLFMAISVFGLVFSNFFSCKLSALLTKHRHHPQVNNFDELRGSDLSVIANHATRIYIEYKFGANFFEEKIPRAIFMNNSEVARHMLSLNDNYMYITLSEKWTVMDSYQKSFKRNILCTSKDLTIISGIPKMHVLGNNSIYDWSLSHFLRRVRESGITKLWITKSLCYVRKSLNITQFPSSSAKGVPIGFEDLMWLWIILGFGYALATLVFIIELFSKRSRKH
ncbi:hypothetical protein KR084_000728 [Drosophila pseudotakahashii]|nr:hypothetical protein KR084_000728 [Drosophila pseudotakahashii]